MVSLNIQHLHFACFLEYALINALVLTKKVDQLIFLMLIN